MLFHMKTKILKDFHICTIGTLSLINNDFREFEVRYIFQLSHENKLITTKIRGFPHPKAHTGS